MSKSPNETNEEYARKNELMTLRDKRPLTDSELLELRTLTRKAISHLKFSGLTNP